MIQSQDYLMECISVSLCPYVCMCVCVSVLTAKSIIYCGITEELRTQ